MLIPTAKQAGHEGKASNVKYVLPEERLGKPYMKKSSSIHFIIPAEEDVGSSTSPPSPA